MWNVTVKNARAKLHIYTAYQVDLRKSPAEYRLVHLAERKWRVRNSCVGISEDHVVLRCPV
jgi:hypothetical protein